MWKKINVQFSFDRLNEGDKSEAEGLGVDERLLLKWMLK